MKQFNLEEYLANPSKKIVTRNGRNVKIHCTNYESFQPIIAEIEGISYSFAINGRFYNDYDESRNDLFFAPEKHEGWTNVYEEGTNRYLDGCICSTEEEAKRIRGCGYITTIKIEWEE